MLEITPNNYQILLKHSLSSESVFHSYDKGLSVKGWPILMGMDPLIELLMAFSKVTRLKVDINWDQAGQEEEVATTIARSLQFYEQLTCLELPGCRLNDTSWQEIVACIPEPACLKEIDVRGNPLTEEAVRNIPACFPNLIKLEHDVKREILVLEEDVYTIMDSNTVQGVTKEAREGKKLAVVKDDTHESSDYFMLGIKYENGEGVRKDDKEAFEWYEKAAKQGNVKAQYKLGSMYYNGQGIEKDDKEAFEWCQKAAEKGDAEAQYNLGMMYDNGEGVEKDNKKAFEWFQKATEQGYAEAQYNLGVMYENGEGVKKVDKEAFKWYQKAAEQGHTEAQYNLGMMYENGEGVGKDDKEAFKWFQKAAEKGDADAQYKLGWMYAKGEGVEKDYHQTFKCFQKAANQGHADAQFNLGKMYEKGRGVIRDLNIAFEWFEKAAGKGHANARCKLVLMYKEEGEYEEEYEGGEYIKKDYKKDVDNSGVRICILM
jgi:TPR repeat protein